MKSVKIATWNVNSIRARLERVLPWLEENRPDIVCLQETKVTDDMFPFEAFAQVGYFAEAFGEKSYNGVAILTRHELTQVERGLGHSDGGSEARFISATVLGIRVLSVYVPNGGLVGSSKYLYKCQWLGQLVERLRSYSLSSIPLALCGDLNIAPELRDVEKPEEWDGTVLFNQEMRQEFSNLISLGLVDTFRIHHQDQGMYSWWDYRNLAFRRNNGLRIDHILATPELAKRCTNAEIDREVRKGEKPSDHAAVCAVFQLEQ